MCMWNLIYVRKEYSCHPEHNDEGYCISAPVYRDHAPMEEVCISECHKFWDITPSVYEFR